MAQIISNERMGDDLYFMKTDEQTPCRPGQFYMVRGWEQYPLLSRPISIFDRDEEGTHFLYRVVGEGTKILSKMKKGDAVTLYGPYGNGFSFENRSKVAFVGGGIGTAPLYYAAKTYRENNPDGKMILHLGFEENNRVIDRFKSLGADVRVKIGGFVTDDVQASADTSYYACGPEVMMKVLYEKVKKSTDQVYVSMEKRMAF
ncbi:MAG TPA: dihydroorotate dehydrogenase electron transfer subunit, partial [Eubacteriaceae bacterium]|nr:dihydroorotate dehydrogenase electron transfer subunit [Eubacteriaceae bacterium]